MMEGMEMGFAIVLLLGPGEQETERARDLFDSILCHEGERAAEADVYVVNDGNTHLEALRVQLESFRRWFHLQNPLVAMGRPHLLNKHTAGMLHGLSEIARNGPYRFALKLDTDALIINPFHDKLVRFLDENPRAGVAGSYLRFPDGPERPGNTFTGPRIVQVSGLGHIRPVLRKQPLQVPASLLRVVRRRRVLNQARRNGYVAGHHVQGGSYAVSGAALDAWREQELERTVLLFRDTWMGEDNTVSMLVKALGYDLVDFNGPGEVFGVWFREPQFPPEVLAERYSVIHSVKNVERYTEEGLRSFFREKRQRFAAAPARGD